MEKIDSIEEYLSRDAAGLANTQLDCPYCGNVHTVPIGEIVVGEGVLDLLPAVVERGGILQDRAALLYDAAIRELVEDLVIQPLAAQGFQVQPVILQAEAGQVLHATDTRGAEVVRRVGPDADLLIGVGSGVISDLTKWAATQLGIPFLLVGTAASMNGHASITASIATAGVKQTAYDLTPATAVLFDLQLLASAPLEMTLAGLADITARNTACADWKLSALFRGEDFCPLPFEMMAAPQARMLSLAKDLPGGSRQSLQAVAEAALMSALTMTVMGGLTSPSSGAEHVLSHFWDLMAETRRLPGNLHGTQVGVGVLIGLSLYEIVRRVDPARLDPGELIRQRRSLAELEEDYVSRYGDALGAHFAGVARAKHLHDAAYLSHLEQVLSMWKVIWKLIDPYLVPLDSIRQPLREAGAPTRLADLHRSRDQALEALLYGHHYRPRYTILDLAWELGVLPGAAEEALDRAGVL